MFDSHYAMTSFHQLRVRPMETTRAIALIAPIAELPQFVVVNVCARG